MTYNTIEITFNNGHTAVWDAVEDGWADYAYDGKMFIIKNEEGAWTGLYNIDHIISVVIK